jgi:guanosine-3',5'-bis(diphosphate) 3'-pyrophosphohydrolase
MSDIYAGELLGVSDFIRRTDAFAAHAHRDQRRKYTEEPYVVHPRAVAALVATVTDDENMIAAALVVELTDVSKPADGSRCVRKALDREHIARSSARAKTVKLADLIDNTVSIVAHDPDFARVYMREKQELMTVLVDGDPQLYARAMGLIEDYMAGPCT